MRTVKKDTASKNIFFLILALIFINSSCAPIPKLSKAEKKTIKKALKDSVKIGISGTAGFARNDENTIWYEHISSKNIPKGTVLLIMGNGQDALSWPPKFIDNLKRAGYSLIRYDHRSTGLSTTKEKWKKKKAYSLNDMANDAVAILDTLKIEKSHIVGVSMGGMIGQILAIEHPQRTKTLTSIMSSGDIMDPELPPMSDEVLPKMISTVLKHGFFGNKKGQIQRQIIQKRILMGDATGDIDMKTMAEVGAFNLKKRAGYNLMAARHHYEAILNAGSRLAELGKLETPTLLIHGKNDPVMPVVHGQKLLETIPNAASLFIDNMGHDLPDSKIDEITDRMISFFENND